MSISKHKLLTVNLYRNLLGWCRAAPSAVSLSHLDQSIDGALISSPELLRECMRKSFRAVDGDGSKLRIKHAFEGLRLLYALDVDKLPRISPSKVGRISPSRVESSSFEFDVKEWIHNVEWLPPISEMKDEPFRPSDIPFFSLSSPLMPLGEGEKNHLPLVSYISDIPVAGMEIPLKIFEPRYRELYKDVLSNGSKRFVVPIAHPYEPGRYAKYGWLYEIVRIEDVADQTNGQVHLMSHHLVTRAVRIDSVVNPSDSSTQATYLRVQAEILEDTFAEIDDMKTIEMALRALQSSAEHESLAGRLLTGLAEGNIWSMVSVWIHYLQMQALELQVKIASKIQLQAKQSKTENVDDAMIELAQAPYREELESLLLELSTLVPLLLQESPKDQCRRMVHHIQSRLK